MIANALTMPLRTPEEVVAIALAKAQARLPIGGPAEHMDGRAGIVRAIIVDGLDILIRVELPDGLVVKEAAGYWSRSSL